MHTPLIAAATGLPDRLEPPIGARQFADLLDEGAHRRLFALGLGEPLDIRGRSSCSMVRSAPPEKPSLPEVKTAPLIAASLGDFVDDRAESPRSPRR